MTGISLAQGSRTQIPGSYCAFHTEAAWLRHSHHNIRKQWHVVCDSRRRGAAALRSANQRLLQDFGGRRSLVVVLGHTTFPYGRLPLGVPAPERGEALPIQLESAGTLDRILIIRPKRCSAPGFLDTRLIVFSTRPVNHVLPWLSRA